MGTDFAKIAKDDAVGALVLEEIEEFARFKAGHGPVVGKVNFSRLQMAKDRGGGPSGCGGAERVIVGGGGTMVQLVVLAGPSSALFVGHAWAFGFLFGFGALGGPLAFAILARTKKDFVDVAGNVFARGRG